MSALLLALGAVIVGTSATISARAATRSCTGVGTDATLVTSAQSLVATHDWTFLLGPGFCVAFGNGLLLGYAMLRSGLLPRRLAMIGLVGGSLCLVNSVGVLLGGWDQMSSTGGLLSFPEMIWEGGVLGVYLIVKGFRDPAATTEEPVASHHAPALAAG